MTINAVKKKEIREVITELERVRDEFRAQILEIKAKVGDQLTVLEEMKEDLETEFDDLSDEKQDSDEGQNMKSFIDDLDIALDQASSLEEEVFDKDHFEELLSYLESIIK